jgi:ribosomal protein S18 acetylase RimI-like enzyme
MLEITSPLPSDGGAILEITSGAGVFNATEIACVEEIWQAYLGDPLRGGYSFLICRDGHGRALGFACYGPHALTQGTYDLYWIAVASHARGRGVGRALIRQVETDVIASGGRLLLVETSSSRAYAPARALYASSGYALEASVHDFYAPGDDLLIYAKPLAVTHMPLDQPTPISFLPSASM